MNNQLQNVKNAIQKLIKLQIFVQLKQIIVKAIKIKMTHIVQNALDLKNFQKITNFVLIQQCIAVFMKTNPQRLAKPVLVVK